MGRIQKILDKGLCLGCGLCESLYGEDNAKMRLSNSGFFAPEIRQTEKSKDDLLFRICPSLNVGNDQKDSSNPIWGRILHSYSAHATDSKVRTKGSSGGVVTAIAIYLLEKGIVDSVLQVGSDASDFFKNTLKISKTRDDVLNCAASRYAPVPFFSNILKILETNNDRYCFIGKPCDISALKNLLDEYPQYKSRFVFLIGIVCAGMPSFNATQKIIDSFLDAKQPVNNLVYRGNGWPGYFSFNDATGAKYQMSYNDSWGRVLGRQVHLRCKICPDGIALQADVAVGDAWETKDGYPDFTEKEGESLVLLRTNKSVDIFDQMLKEGIVFTENLEIEKLENIQPYQYARRKYAGARIFAVSLVRHCSFKFHGTGIWHNLFNSSIKRSIKECLGTMKRLM